MFTSLRGLSSSWRFQFLAGRKPLTNRWNDAEASVALSDCHFCPPGRFGPGTGHIHWDACQRCPPGRWGALPGPPKNQTRSTLVDLRNVSNWMPWRETTHLHEVTLRGEEIGWIFLDFLDQNLSYIVRTISKIAQTSLKHRWAFRYSHLL